MIYAAELPFSRSVISRCCCWWACGSGCPKTIWCLWCWMRWRPWIWAGSTAGTGPVGTAGRRSDPGMMVALLRYGYCQGERSGRVTGKRCIRDVGCRVIAGGLHPDHAAIARFRARRQKALGGLFSQVLRLLAAEGMVSLGTLSLDGTKLAGNAAQKANKTLPQTGEDSC